MRTSGEARPEPAGVGTLHVEAVFEISGYDESFRGNWRTSKQTGEES
jgi:hypothetical protein